MARESEKTYTAFAGSRLIASGDARTVALRTKERIDAGENATVLIFEDATGKQVDLDLRGTPEEVLARLPSHPLFAREPAPGMPRTGPGRPRLGVVCREVSLLPRHWEWLERQPGGISAALRRLVDGARKREPAEGSPREVREAAAKFLWAIAGDFPGFEEATRALFAKDRARLDSLIRDWPEGIRDHLLGMVEKAERLESSEMTS